MQQNNERASSSQQNLEEMMSCFTEWVDEDEASLVQSNDDDIDFSDALVNLFAPLNITNHDEESVATETGSAMSEDLVDVASDVEVEDLDDVASDVEAEDLDDVASDVQAEDLDGDHQHAAEESAEGNNDSQASLDSVGGRKNSESD